MDVLAAQKIPLDQVTEACENYALLLQRLTLIELGTPVIGYAIARIILGPEFPIVRLSDDVAQVDFLQAGASPKKESFKSQVLKLGRVEAGLSLFSLIATALTVVGAMWLLGSQGQESYKSCSAYPVALATKRCTESTTQNVYDNGKFERVTIPGNCKQKMGTAADYENTQRVTMEMIQDARSKGGDFLAKKQENIQDQPRCLAIEGIVQLSKFETTFRGVQGTFQDMVKVGAKLNPLSSLQRIANVLLGNFENLQTVAVDEKNNPTVLGVLFLIWISIANTVYLAFGGKDVKGEQLAIAEKLTEKQQIEIGLRKRAITNEKMATFLSDKGLNKTGDKNALIQRILDQVSPNEIKAFLVDNGIEIL